MRDIGAFYLYEIAFHSNSNMEGGGMKVQSLTAHCNGCKHTFLAGGPPLVSNIGEGGAVIECPGCGGRQAVAGAFFKSLSVEPSTTTQAHDQLVT